MKQFSTLFALFACVISLQAQDKTDRTLFVRFKEGKTLDLVDKFLVIDGKPDLQLQLNGLGEWRRTYSISEEKMDSLRLVAEKNLNKKLPDLNQDYRFVVFDAAQTDQALSIIKESSDVEMAKKAPRLFNASAPSYQTFQTYLQTGNTGINAEEVWSFYNNHGEGIKVYDIEYFFNETHTDLPNVTICGPTPEDPFGGGGGDHGTAVFGEIASLNNGIGTTGIAYGSEFFFGGCYYDFNYELENALIESTMHLNPNDIVLIEQQTYGPNYDENNGSQFGLVAVEWIREFYDAIQVVVGQGIIVVEAAGNGQQNFDDPVYAIDNDGHYPFLEGNGSGAIIVGAGSVGTSDVERSTMWFSNYGNAVSIQGNGESIYSTGYGDLFSDTQDELYTADFGGTSGASPIVTGAIALLNSTYLNATGLTLTRDQIVHILTLTGKPQNDGDFTVSEAHIGPLPNIKAAVDYAISHAGVDDFDQSSLMVYPNPGSGTFVINSDLGTDHTFTALYDLSGKEVGFQLKSLANQHSQITLENLPSGIYFLNIVTDLEIQTLKLILN